MAGQEVVVGDRAAAVPLSDLDGSEMLAIVESTPDGMLLLDSQGVVIAANRRVESMFGYHPGQLLGQPVEILVPDRLRSAHVEHRSAYGESPAVHAMGSGRELVGRRSDGTEFAIEVALAPLDERVRGADVIACVRDVTETRELRRQVVDDRRRFASIFHESPVGMRLTRIGPDGSRTIEAANESFAEIVGRPLGDLVGADVDELLDPDDRNASAFQVDEMLHGGRDRSVIEKRLIRADGTPVWVLVDTSVVQREPEMRTLSHVLDISDRRALQAQDRRLERMQDRERIGRGLHDMVIQRLFATGMELQAIPSHDMALDAGDRVRRAVDELDATIREIRNTIFDLELDGGRRVVSAGAGDQLLRDLEAECARLSIESNLSTSGDLRRVPPAVASELIPALREILSNVARHSEATSVVVEVDVGAADLELIVVDDGTGFTSAARRGSGLGNLEGRASDLGGDCLVESAVGAGTVVRWSVPI